MKGSTSRFMRNSPGISNDFLVEYKASILSRVSHLKRKQSDERSGSFDRDKQDSSQFDTIRQSDLSGPSFLNEIIRESRAESMNSYIQSKVMIPISKTRQPKQPETPEKRGGHPIGMLSNSYNFLPELALNKPKPRPIKPKPINEKFVNADPNSTFLNEITEKSIGLNSHRNRQLSLN